MRMRLSRGQGSVSLLAVRDDRQIETAVRYTTSHVNRAPAYCVARSDVMRSWKDRRDWHEHSNANTQQQHSRSRTVTRWRSAALSISVTLSPVCSQSVMLSHSPSATVALTPLEY